MGYAGAVGMMLMDKIAESVNRLKGGLPVFGQILVRCRRSGERLEIGLLELKRNLIRRGRILLVWRLWSNA